MEILRELNSKELDYIIDNFKQNLPSSVRNLNYILSAAICHKASKDHKLSDRVLPKFYTHRNGLKENCTIFGITGAGYHTVWYFSYDLNEIRECINETKLIRWGSDFVFVTIPIDLQQPIFDFTLKNTAKIVINEENYFYYLPIEDALKFETDIPSNVQLTRLTASDAALCNSLWRYKRENSELCIKSHIIVHGGYGLRDKETNELLSFGLINEQIAIGALTTVEKAQRKGYAELIVKYLAKKIAEKGLFPHVYSSTKNFKSIGLINKLGFKKIGESSWIIMG